MNRGTGKGHRRRINRERPPHPPAWVGASLDPPQCPLNPLATTTSSGTTSGSLNQCQPPAGPLQPITRFFCFQEGHLPGATSSTHPSIDKSFMAHALRILQDATPRQREQLFWDVFTQLAEHFGQPYLPLHGPPNYSTLTRLSPSPRNQLTLYDPNQSNRYQKEFEEVKVLGKGGFGQVVKARNRLDDCCYAIKIITMEDQGKLSPDKNLQEVRALAQLNHPRVVRYYNAWLQPDPYPYSISPWTPVATSITGSYSDMVDDDDEGEEEEALAETSSDSSNDENGVGPHLSSPNQESHVSTDDSIIFQSSGNGQGHGHSIKQQTCSGSIIMSSSCTGTGEGAALKTLLSYCQPQRVPPPRKLLYIQMGLCGESLKEWLDQRNKSVSPVAYSMCLEIFKEVLEALLYIHKLGLIHRDVKPANIFFTLEGHHIQLGDFGLAKQSPESPTSIFSAPYSNLVSIKAQRNTSHVGTPLYAAPEVKDGIYGEKSDMFSMGVILLELISVFSTNHHRVDKIQNLRNMRHLDPELMCRWPDIAHWILKLTDPKPANRPSSEELLASSLFAQPFPPPPPPTPLTMDTTIAPMTAPPNQIPTNAVLVLDEAISDIKSFQSEVNCIGTLKMDPIKDYETLKVSNVKAKSSIAINTIERCLSADEENAILREENFTLKKRVEELEQEIQHHKAIDSASSIPEK